MSTTTYDAKLEVKVTKESAQTSRDSQLTDVIKKALQSDSPILQKALKQEQGFRAKTEEELNDLLTATRKLMTEKNKEQVKKATLERLSTDLELVAHLNTALDSGAYKPKDTQPKDYTEGDKATCTYPLKFNKMALAIPGAKALISEHFEDIFCQESLPQGYVYHSKPSDITIIGKNPYSIYGDSKGTFLKTAAFSVYLTCAGITRLQDIGLKAGKGKWIDDTAMAHITHVPSSLDLEKIDKRFEHFTYSFSDSEIPKGFVFVHSGYSFGGQRDTSYRYETGTKVFGPEDCSSWVSKLTGSPKQFSTIDQLYSYRLGLLRDFKITLGTLPSSDYASSPMATTMGDLFEPVVVKDPQKDIRSGQIYAHRSFDLAKDSDKQGPGAGGHTGVVMDFISNGKESNVVILAYGRDMPNEEGFGVQQFPFAPENRRVMLFSVKGQNILEKTENKSASEAVTQMVTHEKFKQ